MKKLTLILVFMPLVQLEYLRIAHNLVRAPCTDRNHFLLAPGVLTAGGSNRVCLSRFHTEGTARLVMTLVSDDGGTSSVDRELPPGDGGCLDISAPLLPNTKADLVTSVTYPEFNCTWERRMTLRIGSGRVLVVHSDRARYRPGDTIRARVFALKADLTPAHGTIDEIWIEGPAGAWEGTRVAQWTRVRSKMGLAQVQHPTDELAPPGMWTIKARLRDGTQGSATFTVANYELPPFQMTVRTAPRILRTTEKLVWTVCVRYPWLEAVEGMLVIRLRGAGSSTGGIRTAVQLKAPRACHRHAAATWRVGLMGKHPPDVVVADFSFQEQGTRVWQNITVVSQVVDKPITLEFVSQPRIVVTPNLPYSIKVKATRWNGKPAVKERIEVCRYNSKSQKPTCNTGDSSSTGIVRVFFTVTDSTDPINRFEANLVNDTSIKAVPVMISTPTSNIQAVLGPLRTDGNKFKTFVPMYLSLRNVTRPITVHFVVITRGGIIHRWGATTQCPSYSTKNQIHSTLRFNPCKEPSMMELNENIEINKNDTSSNNVYEYLNKIARREISKTHKNKDVKNKNDLLTESVKNKNQNQDFNEYFSRYMNQAHKNNESNAVANKNKLRILHDNFNSISDRFNNDRFNDKLDDISPHNETPVQDAPDILQDINLLKVVLPVKVTSQMCPDSHLLAYFYHDGEFVSAGKHFGMDDCFVDKVDLTWHSRQAQPGSTTTLQVGVHGPALCALTVTDIAAKLPKMATVKDVVMANLKGMMAVHRNLTEYDNTGNFPCSEEEFDGSASSLELTAAWLASAGVRAVGDMPLTKQCRPAAIKMPAEVKLSRSDFSESWLWRVVTVGGNDSVIVAAQAPDSITRFEANAVCLTKTGISVAKPSILQVFSEFFIHADGPKRLRRGDSTIIRYRLFNYLYKHLSIQIQILTDPHLQSKSDLVESVCLPPRSSNARRVEILAKTEGEGKIYIRAKAVKDDGCGTSGTDAKAASDEVTIKIKVEPEGVPVNEQKSILLCGTESRNLISRKSEVSWSWPKKEVVPGTESLTVWAISNITGPLLGDADSLVLLPRGCGEQNMARLATNLLALSHLHPTCAAAATAREHVVRGYNRQLQYIHPSGGFSAFGPSDPVASTWLTAFTVRYLRRAHKLIWPGLPFPPAISKAEDWLLDQQMENGCFRNEGQVFHREFTGGLDEDGEIASVALTAYVITSLVEGTSPIPRQVVVNTLSCLRALKPYRQTKQKVYAHALLTFAFVRLQRYEEEIRSTNEAGWMFEKSLKHNEGLSEVLELIKMASREEDYMWWETNSLSTSIEATSYALMALKESPVSLQEYGAGAVRWLAAHRSATGGFISTQDTLVALEALSAWSSFQQSSVSLNVTAVAGTKLQSVHLLSGMTIPDVMLFEGENVKITAEGTGCALIQATRSYNTLEPEISELKTMSVRLQVHTDGEFDCDADSCYCAAIVEACVLWLGAFPEMALLEVALPGGYEADAKRLYSQLNQTDTTMLRRIELSGSNSRATFYLTSVPSSPRHVCVMVHAVGPRAETKPAHARVLDYYRPSVNDTQIYTIPENCPPRIADTSSDITRDNIFNSARSLTNSEEILIDRDYDMEDMPKLPTFIPLENLKKHDATAFKDLISGTDNARDKDNNSDNGKLVTSVSRRKSEADNKKQMNKARLRVFDVHEDQFMNLNKNIGRLQNKMTYNINDQSTQIDRNRRIVNTHSSFFDTKLRNPLMQENSETFEGKNTPVKPQVNKEAPSYPHDDTKITNINKDVIDGNSNKEGSIMFTQEQVMDSENINKSHRIPLTNPQAINLIQDTSSNHHLLEVRDEHHPQVDNPNLSGFHVIDSEKDLEVPTGMEGPIPSVVLPPPNFAPVIYPDEIVPTTTHNFTYSEYEQHPDMTPQFTNSSRVTYYDIPRKVYPTPRAAPNYKPLFSLTATTDSAGYFYRNYRGWKRT